jgi:DNA-binding NtrC family response regulator
MPLPAQAKILRVLQDKEILRVGAMKAISADVRIIAATNRDLITFIAEGKFREDLYYRLKVIDIHIPALRERSEDIPLLVEYFLNRHNQRYHQQKRLSREALRTILEHPWPGNIRELENTIERAFVLSRGSIIKNADLPVDMISSRLSSQKGNPNSERSAIAKPDMTGVILIPNEGLDLGACLHQLEKTSYEEAIRKKDGNREAAARLLGIQPHTFRKRAKKKFGL